MLKFCVFNKQVNLLLVNLVLTVERIVDDVNSNLFAKFGKQWDSKGLANRLGKQPLEAAKILVKDFELPCSAEEYLKLSTPMFRERWPLARPLPGATRLVQHLHAHMIPIALASNSPKANILGKLSHQPGWKDFFKVIIGGDEVKQGKPDPEIYITIAEKLGVDPDRCLVIEDSPIGVKAGKAAGMKVVAVPSLRKKGAGDQYKIADLALSSLLDFKPEAWGLPCFQDWVCNALPIEPWYVGGPVIKGFGRGSKVLGIPTANLPTAAFSKVLSDCVCGIYLGWAGLSNRGVFKMVMSVGWNPYFDNAEKTVEPWLLHEFPEDFYGEELRLVVVGYIRPEANFPSLQALIERIHEDGRVAKCALEVAPYSDYQRDSFLTTPLLKDGEV
ncbi:hypothetical protein L7F22_020561 [Adiantum nelumboides]|nr:hypothetical protein [Adiantum nelumboides]